MIQINVTWSRQESFVASMATAGFDKTGMHVMLRNLLRVRIVYSLVLFVLTVAAFAEDRPAGRAIQEEVWAIPVTLPTIAYVVRHVGDGHFLITSPDSIPLWAPLVGPFLEKHG